MKVLFVTPSLSENSLGRTYCLFLLCNALGWSSETWSGEGDEVWAPLADDAYASTCHRARGRRDEVVDQLVVSAKEADLIIAVKPLPASLGLAHEVGERSRIPVVCDIDDPDLEVLTAKGQPLKSGVKRLVKPDASRTAKRMRGLLQGLERLVSNPELHRLYGGTLLPHVRPDAPYTREHSGQTDGVVRVAFVGSIQPHKGVDLLRNSLDAVAREGYELTVTADPPSDARPHERWVGVTTLAQGTDLVRSSDVVVIPSRATPWARGQLPVKLVDAMLLGVSVIVSDVAPLPWAVGDAGVVFKAGSARGLTTALRQLGTGDERGSRGVGLQALARRRYTVEANLPAFEAACRRSLQGSPG